MELLFKGLFLSTKMITLPVVLLCWRHSVLRWRGLSFQTLKANTLHRLSGSFWIQQEMMAPNKSCKSELFSENTGWHSVHLWVRAQAGWKPREGIVSERDLVKQKDTWAVNLTVSVQRQRKSLSHKLLF